MTTTLPTIATVRAGALSDTAIAAAMKADRIAIEPFSARHLGSNSYDVHLGRWLACYRTPVLDCARENAVDYFKIPPGGYLLRPGILYLGVTEEWTRTDGYLPWIDGCSSLARLGLTVHQSAGRGDVGWAGNWTLEMVVQRTRPRPWWAPWRREGVIVYPGQRIGQLTYFEMSGEVARPYGTKRGAKYVARRREDDPQPQPSRSFRDFEGRGGRGGR